MATRKVEINNGAGVSERISEVDGNFQVKTDSGVQNVKQLLVNAGASTPNLIWQVPDVPPEPTQPSTQPAPPNPCETAVCLEGTSVEYPAIPNGNGERWNCPVWSKTANLVKGSHVGDFKWQWHVGEGEHEVAKIYNVNADYLPPPPGYIVLDYGMGLKSSQIVVFLHRNMTRSGMSIHTDVCPDPNGGHAMPEFTQTTAGDTFNNQNGSASQVLYSYRCDDPPAYVLNGSTSQLGEKGTCAFSGGQGSTPVLCNTSPTLGGPVLTGSGGTVICECSSVKNQCVAYCCGSEPSIPACPATQNPPSVPCPGTEVTCDADADHSLNALIDQGSVVPLIDTGCINTSQSCQTVCYSTPGQPDPISPETAAPIFMCRSVARVPNVTTMLVGTNYPVQYNTASHVYHCGLKYHDFGLVILGGCQCGVECPSVPPPPCQCASMYSIRLVLPFYFDLRNTLFEHVVTGGDVPSSTQPIDLRGKMIDITFPYMFKGVGDHYTPGGYPPGNNYRQVPPILSAIRDLLAGKISSCGMVMFTTEWEPDPNPANANLNTIYWAANEFPFAGGTEGSSGEPTSETSEGDGRVSHTHQLVLELSLGQDQICNQCLQRRPSITNEFAYNIDAFQFWPITDTDGKFSGEKLKYASFLQKSAGGNARGISSIKSLQWVSHPSEQSSYYGNVYTNKIVVDNYNNSNPSSYYIISNRADAVYSGIHQETETTVEPFVFTSKDFEGVTNPCSLNRILNIIQQQPFLTTDSTNCACETITP